MMKKAPFASSSFIFTPYSSSSSLIFSRRKGVREREEGLSEWKKMDETPFDEAGGKAWQGGGGANLLF